MRRQDWKRKLKALLVTPRDTARDQFDLALFAHNRYLQASHPNPLNKFGRKVFSQTDEDGITLEIIRRLGLQRGGIYAEFGVGNGLENNTLILAALGWRGFWIGGDKLAFKAPESDRFIFIREWVTLDNVVQLAHAGMKHLGAAAADVVSVDLDGNDIYFVEKLLGNGVTPPLFIVEYNAKFPPPIEFRIDYDPQHTWRGDDYFGASLASFAELFSRFSYRLVCCNSHSGSNAFFIRSELAAQFSDVPRDMADIYVECRYFEYNRFGHKPSPRVPELILRGGARPLGSRI